MIDKKLYTKPFILEKLPLWKCPTCNSGALEVVKDTFKTKDTASTIEQSRHDENFEAEWTKMVYTCVLRCSSNACKESVICSGIGGINENFYYDHQGKTMTDYESYYTPKFFLPHLNFFSIPEQAPMEISESIKCSFQLFFCDSASAASHLRIALEKILTNLKVPRFKFNTRKKKYSLSLHQRIILLKSKFSHIKTHFLAVKWLGNVGSHASEILTSDDVLNAYDIIDVILQELYAQNRQKIQKLAKQIHLKKGPINRKKICNEIL